LTSSHLTFSATQVALDFSFTKLSKEKLGSRIFNNYHMVVEASASLQVAVPMVLNHAVRFGVATDLLPLD
jgi:hypothetical protein